MNKPLVDRIPFAKIVTVLAIVFGVSLGLCGLTFVVSSGGSNGGGFIWGLGWLEFAAMAISATGMVLTVVVWVILSAVSSFGSKASQPQKLFDEEDKPEDR